MIPGVKHDQGKPRFSLLPSSVLWGTVRVLEYGSAKYADHNWIHVADPCNRYFDAMMRHLDAMEQGQDADPESGHPHTYHFTCCALLFAWHFMHSFAARDAWRNRFGNRVPVGVPNIPPLEQEEIPPGQVTAADLRVAPGMAPRCEHSWTQVDPDHDPPRWLCSPCGAFVERRDRLYVRFDHSGDDRGPAHEYRGAFSTFFQATHLP